jgi:hypothetical protein
MNSMPYALCPLPHASPFAPYALHPYQGSGSPAPRRDEDTATWRKGDAERDGNFHVLWHLRVSTAERRLG